MGGRAPQPVAVASSVQRKSQIHKVIADEMENWREFGRQLKISDSVLSNLDQQSDKDISTNTHRIMELVEARRPDNIVDQFVEALAAIERMDIIKKIRIISNQWNDVKRSTRTWQQLYSIAREKYRSKMEWMKAMIVIIILRYIDTTTIWNYIFFKLCSIFTRIFVTFWNVGINGQRWSNNCVKMFALEIVWSIIIFCREFISNI